MYENGHRWRDLIKHPRSNERSEAQQSVASCIAQCRLKRTGHARGARITQGLDATNNAQEEAALIQIKLPCLRSLPERQSLGWRSVSRRRVPGLPVELRRDTDHHSLLLPMRSLYIYVRCGRWAVRVHMICWVSSRTTFLLQNYFLRSYALTTSVLIMKQFIHPLCLLSGDGPPFVSNRSGRSSVLAVQYCNIRMIRTCHDWQKPAKHETMRLRPRGPPTGRDGQTQGARCSGGDKGVNYEFHVDFSARRRTNRAPWGGGGIPPSLHLQQASERGRGTISPSHSVSRCAQRRTWATRFIAHIAVLAASRSLSGPVPGN